MKYIELNVEEKAELRQNLWEQGIYGDGCEYSELSAESAQKVDNAASPEDIPESVMEEAFGIYDFVEEDFFCNV